MSKVSRTDINLVAATLTGDCQAFGVLYDRHAGLVRTIALAANRDQATIDDMTQETFLRAYRQLHTLRNPDRFTYWLAGIARQVVRETARKRKFEPLCDKPGAISNDTPSDLRELIAQLPEEERIAVSLFFLLEEDVTTTAARLQRSRSGTYAVIKKAVTRLAKWWHSDEPAEVKS